jgi:uncharacterized protein (DUF111 family)
VKLKIVDHRPVQAVPEFDICQKIAEEKQVPLMAVYQSALAAGQHFLEEEEKSEHKSS